MGTPDQYRRGTSACLHLGLQEQDLTRKTASACHRKKIESCLVEIAPETARVNAHPTVKILFLNQFFYPDLAPSGKLILDIARHLASKGEQVTVLCGSTRYAEAEDTQAAKNNLDGIRVIRVPSTNFGRPTVGFVPWTISAFSS